MYTLAEFDFTDGDSSDSDSHDTYESISFPKDFNPYTYLPTDAISPDTTDESKCEDDTPHLVLDASEAARRERQIEEIFAYDPRRPWDYDTVREVESDATLPTESSDSSSQSSYDSAMPLLIDRADDDYRHFSDDSSSSDDSSYDDDIQSESTPILTIT